MALVELAKFYNSFEAGVVQGRIEAEGIECHMFDFNMTLEGIGFLIPVRLMVDEHDLAASRRILEVSPDRGARG
jgi:Putative prokaryotic signal transducing protein